MGRWTLLLSILLSFPSYDAFKNFCICVQPFALSDQPGHTHASNITCARFVCKHSRGTRCK